MIKNVVRFVCVENEQETNWYFKKFSLVYRSNKHITEDKPKMNIVVWEVQVLKIRNLDYYQMFK